jgi:hypothetical protein
MSEFTSYAALAMYCIINIFRVLLVKLVPQVYWDLQVLWEVQGTQENLVVLVHQVKHFG